MSTRTSTGAGRHSRCTLTPRRFLGAFVVSLVLLAGFAADRAQAWGRYEPTQWANAVVYRVYGYKAAYACWESSGFGEQRVINGQEANVPFDLPAGGPDSGVIELRDFTGDSLRYVVVGRHGRRSGRMTRRQLRTYIPANGLPRKP